MRIIAVDDEKLALEVLVSSVEKIVPDCEIHGFRKPDEAIDYVCKNGCDVAFLDIKMRGMTGLELARRIKDVSGGVNVVFVTGYSQYSLDAFRLYASDYLLKPVTPEAVQQALDNLRRPLMPKQKSRISVHCFGNFEVFADGKPISFKRSKAKEIFAYLVDRRGATVTMGELMTVIWEEGADTVSGRSNLRNLIHEMKRALAEVGGGDIIVKGRNTVSLNCNAVDCDYFDFLNQIPYAVNSYHGEYMLQYSWAEITTGSIKK